MALATEYVSLGQHWSVLTQHGIKDLGAIHMNVSSEIHEV